MKVVKTILGILAGLWAMFQLPRLIAAFTQHSTSDLSSSYKLGALAGFLFASALCIALFNSAGKD